MTDHAKELRRLAQAALIGPDGVSMRWLNLLKDFQEEANPSEVLDLLDRLEAAESETASWKGLATQFGQEADALRAKIEALEKRLRLILEEPENTMSNSKAMREMVRQARLALEESK